MYQKDVQSTLKPYLQSLTSYLATILQLSLHLFHPLHRLDLLDILHHLHRLDLRDLLDLPDLHLFNLCDLRVVTS